MYEVEFPACDPRRLAAVTGAPRNEAFMEQVARPAVAMLAGRSIVNVNSTGTGGGVAEMLRVLLGYARGVDLDVRWLVIQAGPDFFSVTKRIHNQLYGLPGDGGPLGEAEHAIYERVSADNLDPLTRVVSPGDIVILHDPQTAGLAAGVQAHGARVIWRCHVGVDELNAYSREGWQFLRRYLDPDVVDAYVFTRAAFAPDWVPAERMWAIPPSIDPFAPKNLELTGRQARDTLTAVGILAGQRRPLTPFRRADGTPGHVRRGCDVIRAGAPPGPDAPLVVQVSRWDHAKDMAGVLHAVAESRGWGARAHLALVGPAVSGVADDPEGLQVLRECYELWRLLPYQARSRIQLVSVPMDDLDENALIVNAVQRHASVVVQKSLAEGFGLTVAEAMLKGTPVIGSRVGGITAQIRHGQDGILLEDPYDLAALGSALDALLRDPGRLATMGSAARAHAVADFLPDRHLGQWVDLLSRLT